MCADFLVALTQQFVCSGDGSGMMTMIPWELFGDYVKPDEIPHTGALLQPVENAPFQNESEPGFGV